MSIVSPQAAPQAPVALSHGGVGSALDRAVIALLVTVGRQVVMPRFRNLLAHEVSEKSVGELVTIVDQAAEQMLHEGLERLDPGSRAIGEEACSLDPGLLDRMSTGRVWVIDPLDGTANFAGGRQPFGIIVALLIDGETQAGWIHDPVSGRVCHAWRGEGAHVDGRRRRTMSSRRSHPIAALATQFMPQKARTDLRDLAAQAFDLVPIPRSAAAHYPMLMLGENDFAVFQRTLPWDHAAGVLLLAEAGGHATCWDGSPYRIDDGSIGLIVAVDRATWALGMELLGPTLSEVGLAGLVGSDQTETRTKAI